MHNINHCQVSYTATAKLHDTDSSDTSIDWLVDTRDGVKSSSLVWIGLSSVLRLHQHSTGYMGDSFTGQKTQPTVSKYLRKGRYKSKENPEKANNTKYSSTINSRDVNETRETRQNFLVWRILFLLVENLRLPAWHLYDRLTTVDGRYMKKCTRRVLRFEILVLRNEILEN